jgi:hypothetical protein
MHKLTPDWYSPRPELKKIDNISAIIGIDTNNIKVIEGWISNEDCARAMEIISKTPVNHLATHSYPIHNTEGYEGETEEERLFAEEFGKKMVALAEELYGLPLIRDQKFLYVVHPTGTYIDPHTDILDITAPDYEGDTYESQRERFPYLWSGHLSILAYLNDDYEGGELYFPEHDFGVRPKKGMIIFFPGNLHYVHGVAPVTSGTRYTLSQWSKFKDFIAKPENA